MKKRVRTLCSLVAGIMLLGIMCFSFAQWNTEIEANGRVMFNGKWDVTVKAADIKATSNGVNVEKMSKVEVTVYDYYAIYNENGWTQYLVDDLNPKTILMSEKDLAAYKYVFGPGPAGYKSGFKKQQGDEDISFRLDLNEEYKDKLWKLSGNSDSVILGAVLNDETHEETLIGTAIAWAYGGSTTAAPNNPRITLNYKQALNALAESEPVNAVFTADTVSYASVSYTLPGAWSVYSVTIGNNGTTEANLKDIKFSFNGLDENVFSVKTPQFDEDEVIAPGESCTLEFVIYVNDDVESGVEQESGFVLTMEYVQTDIEAPVPEAVHEHN